MILRAWLLNRGDPAALRTDCVRDCKLGVTGMSVAEVLHSEVARGAGPVGGWKVRELEKDGWRQGQRRMAR